MVVVLRVVVEVGGRGSGDGTGLDDDGVVVVRRVKRRTRIRWKRTGKKRIREKEIRNDGREKQSSKNNTQG